MPPHPIRPLTSPEIVSLHLYALLNWSCFSLSLNRMLLSRRLLRKSREWAGYDSDNLSINEWHLKCHFHYFLFWATCVVVRKAFLKTIILHQKRRYQSHPIRNLIRVLLTVGLWCSPGLAILSTYKKNQSSLKRWTSRKHCIFRDLKVPLHSKYEDSIESDWWSSIKSIIRSN